jgi:hypothetical protein
MLKAYDRKKQFVAVSAIPWLLNLKNAYRKQTITCTAPDVSEEGNM